MSREIRNQEKTDIRTNATDMMTSRVSGTGGREI